jgi:fused signal recognition particle receptor
MPSTPIPAGGGLRARLARTRATLARGLAALAGRGPAMNDQVLEDLEESLILADVGIAASRRLIENLRHAVRREGLRDGTEVLERLRRNMLEMLAPCKAPPWTAQLPYVLLVVGVNGVGKTTTVAKIAHFARHGGKRVLLAAADTFRAAAVEQLQRWGERLEIPVVAQAQGADAAAVAHDALAAALAREVDLLIVDTAGRQHTHGDLMEQLKKIRRVLGKLQPGAPHEVLQVLDAATGQNALSQLQHFHAAVGVNSLVLTKLDGTAKGGVLLALAERFRLPVRFIGVGEGLDDLRPFHAEEFVQALLPDNVTVAD